MAQKQVEVLICYICVSNTFVDIFLEGIQPPKCEISREEEFIQKYNKSRTESSLPTPLTSPRFLRLWQFRREREKILHEEAVAAMFGHLGAASFIPAHAVPAALADGTLFSGPSPGHCCAAPR